MSEHYIRSDRYKTQFEMPCLRTGESLDFFRGEPGVVERPDLFDYGDVQKQDLSMIKAFLEVSKREANVYARWGQPNSCGAHGERSLTTN